MNQLPAPDSHQLAASQALVASIRERIHAAGGWLPFSDYMRLALYEPNFGYYTGGSRKFGAAGDFVTAPELSSLFGRSMARPVAQVLAEVGGDVLEIGAGSGRLAADLLAELAALGILPARYRILELSAELMARQRQTLAEAVPDLLGRVEWLSALPNGFTGCMVGNEVLDAMPCALLHKVAGEWLERGVGWRDGLVWQDGPLADPHISDGLAAYDLPDGYLTEVQLEAQAFVASLADCVAQGALILPDYGFAAAEYYHPQRDQGTLMCHYRHHSHADPFHLPGLEDITTHVDFSAIWRAGSEAGWQLEGYTSQASFLLDAGLLDLMREMDVNDPAYFRAAAAVQKLMGPAEMGELFKVIAFSRNMTLPGLLAGFGRDDRSGAL
ncbi:class I SAM-dependent methyltransferase [Chitinimonas arctica]|uniref:Class I SAM-dependent methyltransferase n=1 Tax=Chitinimonas arctica TaxID=2594795 RepID=A0A516SEM2_9NEIS|nr:SAM-dependent methyltransferase [Chitinimonas arctica]QDQ26606.1 class I SAM-dependent methyltransferase [Chitinimonas arctica]